MVVFGTMSVIVLKKNLIANPSTIIVLINLRYGLTVMRLQILILEKYLKQALIIFVDY